MLFINVGSSLNNLDIEKLSLTVEVAINLEDLELKIA
jgi:hypothetical protein